MSATAPIAHYDAHVGPTAEELARRARMAEIRTKLKELVVIRREVKAAWHLNHAGPEHKQVKAALRVKYGLSPTSYGDESPWRDYKRQATTDLHIELAKLRGKVHLVAPKEPA